jgi:hypothetical protein
MKMRDTEYPRVLTVNDSSNIFEIAYDPFDCEAVVTFKNNVKYLYKNVKPTEFALIASAESVGASFNNLIIKKIKGVKIDS